MAQNKSGANAPSKKSKNNSLNGATASELRKWHEERIKLNYDAASKAVTKLRDVNKTNTKVISAFNKETLRSYLQNIGSNEKNLRSLSRYLSYRSQVYYRLLKYYANMFCLDARSVIPTYDPTKTQNKKQVTKQYFDTLKFLNLLPLQYEFLKIYSTCFREDTFYGCCFYDETGMFILPLDPDYCKIDGQYQTGDFSFSMDMTYYRNRQDVLDFLGEPFVSLYNESVSSGQKWQHFTDEYAVCLKARAEDWELSVPIFSGLFTDLISLLDLSDIQSIADEQQIYKMIWLELETLSNANTANDFRIDPQLVAEYYDKMLVDAVPDYTSAVIVPGKLNTITFDNDAATDVNKVERATETVLNTSGGAQILNSATISGTTAFNAAVKSDTEFAISMLLPQTEAWVNRFISYHVKKPAKVKFFEVSVYTKDELRKSLLESAQYGLPNILAVNTLNGLSELDTLALNYLEVDCLNLHEKFIPVQSTHTQSNKGEVGQGAPTKSDTEITDDGEKSRDKIDKAKG